MNLDKADSVFTLEEDEVVKVAPNQNPIDSTAHLELDMSQSPARTEVVSTNAELLEPLPVGMDEPGLEDQSKIDKGKQRESLGYFIQRFEDCTLECDTCGYRTNDPVSAEVHAIKTEHLSFAATREYAIVNSTDESQARTHNETSLETAKHHFAEILLRKKRRDDHPDALESLSCVADIVQAQAQREDVENTCRRWLRDMGGVLGPEHPEVLKNIYNLAVALHEQGRNDESEELHRKVLEGRTKVLGEENSDTLHSMGSLALVLNEKESSWEGEEYYRRALRGFENIFGNKHTDTLNSANDLANILQRTGRFEEAEQLYRRVVKGREEILGLEHVDTLISLSNLAFSLRIQDSYHEAEQIYRRVLVACEQKYGKGAAETIRSCYGLARVLYEQGKNIDAENLFQRVSKGKGALLGDDPSSDITLKRIFALGTEYRGQKKYKAAEELLRISTDSLEKILGKHAPEAIHSAVNLANVLIDRGKYYAAEPIYLRALERFEITLGRDHVDTVTIYNNLSGVYMKRGILNKAESMYRRAMKGFEMRRGKEHIHTLQTLDNLLTALKAQKKEKLFEELLEEGWRRLKSAYKLGYFESFMGDQLRVLESEWNETLSKSGRSMHPIHSTSKDVQDDGSVKPWLGAQIARGYGDIGDEVDMPNLDIGNVNGEFGGIRSLFSPSEPLDLSIDNTGGDTVIEDPDFVVSDVDEQLMLFVPFKRAVNVHSIHFTSLVFTKKEDETSKRPRTIKFVVNRPHILGFEESVQFVQEIELGEQDWDNESRTVVINTLFVRFQNVSTLGIFVVDGLDQDMSDVEQGEFTRLDRIRIIGQPR